MGTHRGIAGGAAVAAVIVTLSVGGAACGKEAEPDRDGGGGGGGSGGSGYTCAPTSGDPTFRVLAGAWISNTPVRDDGPVTGSLWVYRGDDPVPGAVVTLNGVTAPAGTIGGAYEYPSSVAASVGGTLVVCASDGTDTTSVIVPCAGPVSIRSPAEGTAVAEGETLAVTWSGETRYEGAVEEPQVGIDGYDPVTNGVSGGAETVWIAGGETSAVIEVPGTRAGGYLVRVSAPGPVVRAGESRGSCGFRAGVRLVKR